MPTLSGSQTAHREYADRPADERFGTLADLVANAEHAKNLSTERNYNAKDLCVVTADTHNTPGFDATPGEATIMLESPKGRAYLTHWAFGQLARTVGAPAGYLRTLPPSLVADALNFGLQHETAPGTSLVLLAQAGNGADPMIRACTSETYARVWDADLYGRIHQTLGAGHDGADWQLPLTWDGTRAGAYRGDRDSFLIITNGGSIVNEPMASSPMHRGILVRNSEVGAASLVIEQILFRAICGNHLLWGAVLDRQYRRRHVGVKVLRETVREIHDVAYRWGNRSASQDEAIIRGLISLELAQTREGVIDELRAVGFSAKQAGEAYDRCEQTEGVSPRSYWGLAQGATRLSQDSGYQDDRYLLDRLAMAVLERGARKVAA